MEKSGPEEMLICSTLGITWGDSVDYADACKGQGNTIDDLNNRFVFSRGIVLAIARFFRFHNFSSL